MAASGDVSSAAADPVPRRGHAFESWNSCMTSIHSIQNSESIMHACAAVRGGRATVDLAITKTTSKWGVTLAWRHSLGGYVRPGENFMCSFSFALGGFLQLVQSGPSLEEMTV